MVVGVVIQGYPWFGLWRTLELPLVVSTQKLKSSRSVILVGASCTCRCLLSPACAAMDARRVTSSGVAQGSAFACLKFLTATRGPVGRSCIVFLRHFPLHLPVRLDDNRSAKPDGVQYWLRRAQHQLQEPRRVRYHAFRSVMFLYDQVSLRC